MEVGPHVQFITESARAHTLTLRSLVQNSVQLGMYVTVVLQSAVFQLVIGGMRLYHVINLKIIINNENVSQQ